MQRILLACALAAGLGLAGDAAAQVVFPRPTPNPSQRPAISPFLNLARPGNPAINYYGLVRPQLDTAKQIQALQLQQGQQMFQMGIPSDDETVAALSPISGHAATFFNYSHYFTYGRSGGSGGTIGSSQTPFSINGR